MSYRVEISVSNRAKCAATQCSKQDIKIQKGEIRQGTIVMFQENQSWKYRHWGCVTPTVIHNWWETAEESMDLIDGFDELPEEVKVKVQRTFEQGHVDDEDWNGDLECNRYDPNQKQQGMFLKGARLKAKEAAMKEAGETGSPTKAMSYKRERDADEEDEAKPAKKSKSKKAAAMEEEEDITPVKKAGKKKAAPVAEEDDVQVQPAKKTAKKKTAVNDEAPAKPARTTKKSKAVKAEPEEDAEESEEPPAPKKSRAKSKKPTEPEEIDTAPKKKSRTSKVKTEEPEDINVRPKANGRRKKATED